MKNTELKEHRYSVEETALHLIDAAQDILAAVRAGKKNGTVGEASINAYTSCDIAYSIDEAQSILSDLEKRCC